MECFLSVDEKGKFFFRGLLIILLKYVKKRMIVKREYLGNLLFFILFLFIKF